MKNHREHRPSLRERGSAASAGGRNRGAWWLTAAVSAMLAIVSAAAFWGRDESPGRRHRQAVAEAKELLAQGKAHAAELALIRAIAHDGEDAEPWLLRLELLRVEDRVFEAQRVGWEAYEAVPATSRRAVLRALTLALLADAPADLARDTLSRWTRADADDRDAQIALAQRIAAAPRAGDPDRSARIEMLARILRQYPEHLNAREALIASLADAGETDRGRALLDAWPITARDARYWRLRGRWDLEYDRQPARAVAELTRALVDLPQDWKTHYRLARALQAAERPAEAKRAAATLGTLRETLEPVALGSRLDADLAKLDVPSSRLDLADLCAQAGLKRLAEAWRRDAAAPAPPVGGTFVQRLGRPDIPAQAKP